MSGTSTRTKYFSLRLPNALWSELQHRANARGTSMSFEMLSGLTLLPAREEALIDAWRALERDKPSRSEAVRRLVLRQLRGRKPREGLDG
jgi:hypothetical protein